VIWWMPPRIARSFRKLDLNAPVLIV
jgi:hypothetical protein